MRGVPQIEVTFAIDANGIVNVSAKDLATGNAQDITITATSNMSREEIDRAVREAQQYAREDGQTRARADARDRAERALYRAASVKAGKENKSYCAELQKELKSALKTDDPSAINAAAQRLEDFLQHMGSEEFDGCYKPTQDDVMDASYEPVDEN